MNDADDELLPTPNSMNLSAKAYCLLVAIAKEVGNRQGGIYEGDWQHLAIEACIGGRDSYLKCRRELIAKGFIQSENEWESGPSSIRTKFRVKLLVSLYIGIGGLIGKRAEKPPFESVSGVKAPVHTDSTRRNGNQAHECRRADSPTDEKQLRRTETATYDPVVDNPDFISVW